MSTFRFKNKDLQGILTYTKNAKEYTLDFTSAVVAYQKATGKEWSLQTPDSDIKAFLTTNTPTLYIVKDEGIYLMTAASEVETPKDKSHIAYAVGYNPDKDSDVYDKARNAVGGDDFGESFEFTPEMQQFVERGADIVVKVTPETIEISAEIKAKKTVK